MLLMLLLLLLRTAPTVWTVENDVTAVMLMDVITPLVTAAVWLDGLVRPHKVQELSHSFIKFYLLKT